MSDHWKIVFELIQLIWKCLEAIYIFQGVWFCTINGQNTLIVQSIPLMQLLAIRCFEEICYHRHFQAHLLHYFDQGQILSSMRMIPCRIQVRPGYFINRMRPTWSRQNMTHITWMIRPSFNPDLFHIAILLTNISAYNSLDLLWDLAIATCFWAVLYMSKVTAVFSVI